MSDISDDDFKLYFGKDADKYIEIRNKILQGKIIIWSWWAALFTHVWAGYRKWTSGLIAACFLTIINGLAFTTVIMFFVAGMFGPYRTAIIAARQIQSIKDKNTSIEKQEKKLRQKGQHSWLLATFAIILILISSAVHYQLRSTYTTTPLQSSSFNQETSYDTAVNSKDIIRDRYFKYQAHPLVAQVASFEKYMACVKDDLQVIPKQGFINDIILEIHDSTGDKIGKISFRAVRANYYEVSGYDLPEIEKMINGIRNIERVSKVMELWTAITYITKSHCEFLVSSEHIK